MVCQNDQILRMFSWMVYEFCTSYLSFGGISLHIYNQPTGRQVQEKSWVVLFTGRTSTGHCVRLCVTNSWVRRGPSPQKSCDFIKETKHVTESIN